MPAVDRIDSSYALLAHDYRTDPTKISISGSSAASTVLSAGKYLIISDTACYFLQGNSAVAATSNSHYLPAGQVRFLDVITPANTNDYIAAIQVSTAGSMYIHRLTI